MRTGVLLTAETEVCEYARAVGAEKLWIKKTKTCHAKQVAKKQTRDGLKNRKHCQIILIQK